MCAQQNDRHLKSVENRSGIDVGLKFHAWWRSDMSSVMEGLMHCKERFSYVHACGTFLKIMESSRIKPEDISEFLMGGNWTEGLKNLDGWHALGEKLSNRYLDDKTNPTWPEIATIILSAKGRTYGLRGMSAVLKQSYDAHLSTGKLTQPHFITQILTHTFLAKDGSYQEGPSRDLATLDGAAGSAAEYANM
jgi:hypothetical protein